MQKKQNKKLTICILGCCLLGNASLVEVSLAEPVTNHYLSEARLADEGTCSTLTISFNFRTRYLNHFPGEKGRELRINIKPLDQGVVVNDALYKFSREALRALRNNKVSLDAIEFESNAAGGHVLSIHFPKPVHYAVTQGSDFRSVQIAINPNGDATSCIRARRPTMRQTNSGKITKAKARKVAIAFSKGQKAIKAKKYGRAIALFSKILQAPENKFTPSALEFLGLARERTQQLAHAKAEYKDYLKRYPDGPGAARVRQRLAGLVTSTKAPKTSLRKAKNRQKKEGVSSSISGSLSSYYFRNDRYRDLGQAYSFSSKNYELGQSELVNSADITARIETPNSTSKMRFSGSHIKDFANNKGRDYRLSALYFDTHYEPWALSTRLGRQTLNTAGIPGRFDGASFGWQYSQLFKFNAAIGAPVSSTRNLFLEEERFFFGASVDITPLWNAVDGSLYFIEQTGLSNSLERRAIGAELRYSSDNQSAFGLLEYDIEQGDINTALFSGSHTFSDKSVLTLSADYRRSFVLKTLNNLDNNQTGFDTLVQTLRGNDGYDYYFDRSAISKSATIGFSRPIGKNFQVNLNATVTNFQFGKFDNIDGSLPEGNEYFYSGQLIGNSLLKDGDIYTLGLRYADTLSYDAWTVDLNARYPVTRNLRIGPRLRVRTRKQKTGDLQETSVLPSVRMNYQYMHKHHFELELGSEWVNRKQFGISDGSVDYFLAAGYRFDF
ncbi:MAG: hypothetical protein L3J67_01920 [Hyphomicrobiaceae bacterium]|nr:hypothetical protein [Hyphomicrobiaceae bacterium]